MLGFDALGRLALGQVSSSTAVLVALTTTIGANAKASAGITATFNATTRIGAQTRFADPLIALFPASTRIGAQVKTRVTPGFALKTTIAGQVNIKESPGVLITARMSARSYATADIHVQGTLTTTRKALLLDGSAPLTASYWKGNA